MTKIKRIKLIRYHREYEPITNHDKYLVTTTNAPQEVSE